MTGDNKYSLRQVPLDEYGYDDNGHYYGLLEDEPLFYASNGADDSHYFRAANRTEAKEMLRLQIPGIRFFN